MSVKVRRHRRGWWQVTLRVRLPNQELFEQRHKSPFVSKSASLRWGEEWQTEVLSNWREVLKRKDGKVIPTLSEFVERFMRDHVRANKLKPSTIATYENRLNKQLVPILGDHRLDQITAADVQKLKAVWSKLAGKTINSALGVLSKVLNAALEWGVLDGLQVKIKKLKLALVPYPFYDFAQYANVVAGATEVGAEAVAIVLLGGDAGLRRGEIAALEWKDIDFKGRALTVQRTVWNGEVTAPKGGRSRTIPMTPGLTAALNAIRHLRGPRVFCSEEGDDVTEGSINESMETVLRHAGMGRSRKVHILRHTFCSHLAMQGAPAKAIQELAGHTDLTTTMRYMHLAPGSLAAAVKLLESRPTDPEHGNMAETKAANSPNPP